MHAMAALGGTGTHKQVQEYLRRHPDLFEGTNPSNFQRCLEGIRLIRYCERRGRNKAGELVFGVPAKALPRGVRLRKDGFVAYLQTPEATLSGPVRSCPEAASQDYSKLSRWRTQMASNALMQRVSAWDGARVMKGYRGTKADRKPGTARRGKSRSDLNPNVAHLPFGSFDGFCGQLLLKLEVPVKRCEICLTHQ